MTILSEGKPLLLPYRAAAAYHGHSALAMLALTFQGLRGALTRLSPAAPVDRAALTVTSGHPGPGVRDAIEFVTRAVTRGAYTVDRSLPEARVNPHAAISYSFRLHWQDRTLVAALREGVLPDRFYALVAMPKDQHSPATLAEADALKSSIAERVLLEEPESLYAYA
ncbi:hypothetical protein EOD42_24130 [Rhodovarius crocodyli]|uniref:Uncharacterized protein n=1 Tax=Rhodovarius crocodyli TaxID=1979269 RepID=A0A437LXD1_9PROT|nr:hypothetical protein EOD42_24130 [Rhodovarius crocodyli]